MSEPDPGSGQRAEGKEPSLSSVEKALALLDALAEINTKVGLSELARRVELSKSTAFRLLAVLADAGVVERRGTDYQLGVRLFELGAAASRTKSVNLRERSLPYLEELYELTHDTVSLAIMHGSDVLYIEKLFGRRSTTTPAAVGARLPVTCVALGKAILAHVSPERLREVLRLPLPRMTRYSPTEPGRLLTELRKVRESGIAFDIEGAQYGLTCAAAPIFDSRNRVVAAVSVSGSSTRFDANGWGRAVVRSASLISTTIMPDLDPLDFSAFPPA